VLIGPPSLGRFSSSLYSHGQSDGASASMYAFTPSANACVIRHAARTCPSRQAPLGRAWHPEASRLAIEPEHTSTDQLGETSGRRVRLEVELKQSISRHDVPEGAVGVLFGKGKMWGTPRSS